MGRRLEVELTSSGADTWTWRAAGALQPKGDVKASLLYNDAKVGDVVVVEAEYLLDGIEITEVNPPKAKKERSDLLELKTRALRKDQYVTADLAKKGRNKKRSSSRGRDSNNSKRTAPERPQRERPTRLKPARAHRLALIQETPEEHRIIIEQLISDGMGGVRKAIEQQNAELAKASKPQIDPTPILDIAEKALHKVRTAEWRDRADDALAKSEKLDLRDFRSVVVAGAGSARSADDKKLLAQLQEKLDGRIESDHNQWMADIAAAVEEERTVAALKISSRPVKAGTPLPPELASKLSEQASHGLASDVTPHRWTILLDALSTSPVRAAVTPLSVPTNVPTELMAELRRLSDKLPQIAKMFGIDPASVPDAEKKAKKPWADRKDSRKRSRRTDSKRADRSTASRRGSDHPEVKNKTETPEKTRDQASEPTATDIGDSASESPEQPISSAETGDKSQILSEPSNDSINGDGAAN